MGKSLIIKGADFSENGMPINIVLGKLVKTNTTAALNTAFSKDLIEGLNPTKEQIQVVLGTDNETVNSQMSGKTVYYIKSTSPYATYGAARWGNLLTINIADLGSSIRCQSQGNTFFENVEVWLKVIE